MKYCIMSEDCELPIQNIELNNKINIGDLIQIFLGKYPVVKIESNIIYIKIKSKLKTIEDIYGVSYPMWYFSVE